MGEWRSPEKLCFAKDRLYLVEEEDELERRILVLSLQGDILQVVMHPTEPTAEFTSICCFDHKLLTRYHYVIESAGTRTTQYGILALQGL